MKKLIPTTLDIGLENIIDALLTILGVKISKSTIKERINSHPNYPSLLSLAETLKGWNIDSLAIKTTLERLPDLPLPFVAHTYSALKPFILVRELNSSEVNYVDDRGKIHTVPMSQFSKNWDGNVLAIESNADSGENDYAANLKKERWGKLKIPLIIFTLLLITLFNVLRAANINDPFAKIYMLISLIIEFFGMIITILLLWQEYDHNNTTVNKICTFSIKTDCNAILNSKGSKLFNIVSWSEVGFIYFTGSILFLSIGVNDRNVVQTIILTNIIVLPYILFSIYYQAFIVKQWCILCLLVQIALGTNFLAAVFTNHISALLFHNLLSINYPVLLLSYFIPTAIWVLLKKHIYDNKELITKSYMLNRFKSNPDIFAGFLTKQIPLKVDPGNIGIFIGNTNAENTIIKVCNPYCGPCADVHPKIEHLVKGSDKWNVRIIFTSTVSESDMKYKPTAHLMSVYKFGDETQTREALDNWYNQASKNYESFSNEYPVKSSLSEQNEEIALMSKWCTDEGIEFTPTIYVNGYRMPEEYSIEELSNF